MERFNQTLKEEDSQGKDGKDWDKLILANVLFAYREVPHESTGFFPFELLYGRDVRGPLDVLKETWETSPKSDESVLSHVPAMREQLEKMAGLVEKNLAKTQYNQKQWYNHCACQQRFKTGDQVVLLPTTTSKLTARRQGLVKPVGKVNYLVNVHDKQKNKRVFHVNMFKEWCIPSSTAYFAQDDGEMTKFLSGGIARTVVFSLFSGGAVMSVGEATGRLYHSDEQHPREYIIS